MIPFVDLTKQYLSLKNRIDKATTDVLNSGWFILGPQVESFEKEFSDYIGAEYAVAVGSGTEALQISLMACGITQKEHEVITAVNTAVPTVAAIEAAGATPVLVDVDPYTYLMDPSQLARKISSKTKAIIPVHLYGKYVDMDELLKIAKKYNLKVIEDCAQATGATHSKRKAGSVGDIGCFSFYPTKNLGAVGDGGMIVSSDRKLAETARLIRSYGERKKYFNEIKGINSRMDEIQAAILGIKLKHIDEWNNRRIQKADLYRNLLSDVKSLTLPKKSYCSEHVYHLFVIRTERRDELQIFLKEHGIATAIHYPMPIHFQQAYKNLGYSQGDFPIAEKYSSQILSLPLFPELPDIDITFVANKIKKFFL
jgi:dTDP-4-amino-4,6-dideoxygalactose transaminase